MVISLSVSQYAYKYNVHQCPCCGALWDLGISSQTGGCRTTENNLWMSHSEVCQVILRILVNRSFVHYCALTSVLCYASICEGYEALLGRCRWELDHRPATSTFNHGVSQHMHCSLGGAGRPRHEHCRCWLQLLMRHIIKVKCDGCFSITGECASRWCLHRIFHQETADVVPVTANTFAWAPQNKLTLLSSDAYLVAIVAITMRILWQCIYKSDAEMFASMSSFVRVDDMLYGPWVVKYAFFSCRLWNCWESSERVETTLYKWHKFVI